MCHSVSTLPRDQGYCASPPITMPTESMLSVQPVYPYTLLYWYKSTNSGSAAARRLDFIFHYASRMLSMEPVYQSRLGNNHGPTEEKHLADKRDVVDYGRARHVHRVDKEGKELEERVVP